MANLPKAPKFEGVDPLTDGKRYHGEDVKGNSKLHTAAEGSAQPDTTTDSDAKKSAKAKK